MCGGDGSGLRPRPVGEGSAEEVIRVDLAVRPGRLEPDFPSLMRRQGPLGQALVPDPVGLSPVLVFRRFGSFRLDVHPPEGFGIETGPQGEPVLAWSDLGPAWSPDDPPPGFTFAERVGDKLVLHWALEAQPVPYPSRIRICRFGLVPPDPSARVLPAVIGIVVRTAPVDSPGPAS
jgi:hypothetical protein